MCNASGFYERIRDTNSFKLDRVSEVLTNRSCFRIDGVINGSIISLLSHPIIYSLSQFEPPLVSSVHHMPNPCVYVPFLSPCHTGQRRIRPYLRTTRGVFICCRFHKFDVFTSCFHVEAVFLGGVFK